MRLTQDQKAKEVARIKDVLHWPRYPVLHVKKLGEVNYECFGTIAADGLTASSVVHDKFTDHVERFTSIEAMVEAGWIGD